MLLSQFTKRTLTTAMIRSVAILMIGAAIASACSFLRNPFGGETPIHFS
jgi:hypothetical protein